MSAPTVPARMKRLQPGGPTPHERAVALVDALLCEWCDQSIVARLCRCPKPRPAAPARPTTARTHFC